MSAAIKPTGPAPTTKTCVRFGLEDKFVAIKQPSAKSVPLARNPIQATATSALARRPGLGSVFALTVGMNAHQAIVWLDHQEARVFGVDPGMLTAATVAAPLHHVHRHAKGPTAEREHPSDATHFFKDIAAVVGQVDELLVVGPSTAKLHFLRYLAKSNHALEAKIVGVETADHPTDGQLVAHARSYFAMPKHARA